MEKQASNTTIGCLTIAGVFICLAAIAAVLFPIFAPPIRHCTTNGCLANLKELAIGLRMYMDDNGGCLPSSLIRYRKTKSSIPQFCSEISPGFSGTHAPIFTYADALKPYNKVRELFFCKYDKRDIQPPSTLTSYVYRPAVDQAAINGYGREKDFAYPAAQIVLFDRLGFDTHQTDEGWNTGVKLNCAFLDAHVASVGAPDATMSGVPRADIPDEPGPALNKALNQPGWPCWFNYDPKTKTEVKRKAWDPRRYRDEVN